MISTTYDDYPMQKQAGTSGNKPRKYRNGFVEKLILERMPRGVLMTIDEIHKLLRRDYCTRTCVADNLDKLLRRRQVVRPARGLYALADVPLSFLEVMEVAHPDQYKVLELMCRIRKDGRDVQYPDIPDKLLKAFRELRKAKYVTKQRHPDRPGCVIRFEYKWRDTIEDHFRQKELAYLMS